MFTHFRFLSDNFPGLRWMNAEKTIFRIPWKHAGKFSWREEDCLIFKVSQRFLIWFDIFVGFVVFCSL